MHWKIVLAPHVLICIHFLYSMSACQRSLHVCVSTAVCVSQACNCPVFGRRDLKDFNRWSPPAIVGVHSSWHL